MSELPSILAHFQHHPKYRRVHECRPPTSARPRPPLKVRARTAALHQALVQLLRQPAPSRFCTVSPVSGALHRAAPPLIAARPTTHPQMPKQATQDLRSKKTKELAQQVNELKTELMVR